MWDQVIKVHFQESLKILKPLLEVREIQWPTEKGQQHKTKTTQKTKD